MRYKTRIKIIHANDNHDYYVKWDFSSVDGDGSRTRRRGVTQTFATYDEVMLGAWQLLKNFKQILGG